MNKEHDEEWVNWIRAEYKAPDLTSLDANRIQQAAVEERSHKYRRPMTVVAWACACVCVMMVGFSGLAQIAEYQKRENLAAQADIVWAIELLESPTIDEDETEYLPEAFQTIAQLNTTLDFQDLNRR